MPTSPLLLYNDAMELLNAALANGNGVTYEADSPAQASTIAQRCNKARKLLRDEGGGFSVYDAFIIRRAKDSSIVEIILRPSLNSDRIKPL